jgi:hypothetical protein
LSVRKVWITYTGIDHKHVTQRVKLIEMLSWNSLFMTLWLSTCQSTKSSTRVNPQGRSAEKVKLLLNGSHLEPQAVRSQRYRGDDRGLSPKIISRDSRRSENAQTYTNKHTIPNMKFKLKLLQIKCHVLGFTKDKAQNMLQKIIRDFVEAFVSHDRDTLFALEESEPPRMTYTCESQ